MTTDRDPESDAGNENAIPIPTTCLETVGRIVNKMALEPTSLGSTSHKRMSQNISVKNRNAKSMVQRKDFDSITENPEVAKLKGVKLEEVRFSYLIYSTVIIQYSYPDLHELCRSDFGKKLKRRKN